MPRPIIVLCGPTGIGKSEVAVPLARALKAEIISADSMQVYRGLQVTTAVPRSEAMREVPHHLINAMELTEDYNAARFRREALKIITQLQEEGKNVLVVGGSGLYIRALVDGLFSGPSADDALRQRLLSQTQSQGPLSLFSMLEKVDPLTAQRLHPGDVRRVIRALEVYHQTGEPISRWFEKGKAMTRPLKARMLGLNMVREALYARIDKRVDEMFERGLVEEIQSLVNQGLKERLLYIKPLGFSEIFAYLNGEIDLLEAKRLLKRNSRRYAKRQLTWFGKDKRISWLWREPEEHPQEVAARLLTLLHPLEELEAS